MTIIVGVKGESFGLVAADRIASGVDDWGVPVPIEMHTKVVLHPTLPIAVASSGFSYLPRNGLRTTTHVARVLAILTAPEQLNAEEIVDHVRTYFRPLVERATRENPVGHEDKARLMLGLVYFSNDEINILQSEYTVAKGLEWATVPQFRGFPEELREFYRSGPYAPGQSAFRGTLKSPDLAPQRLAEIIGDGVREDARLRGGGKPQVWWRH